MRKESATVQKCKRQMATLGFDSQLAYHRVKLILKIYRDVVWVLSERMEELHEYAWELIPGLSICKASPRIWICRSLRNGSAV